MPRWWGSAHAGAGAAAGALGVVVAGWTLVPALFGGGTAIIVWFLLVVFFAVGTFGVLDWWFSPLRRVSRSVVLGIVTAAVWFVSVVACVVAVAASGSGTPDPLNPPLLVVIGGASGAAVTILLRYRGWARWGGIAAASAALVMLMVISFQGKADDDLAGLQSYFGSTVRPYVSPIDGYDDPTLAGHGATVMAFYTPVGKDPAPMEHGAKTIVVITEQFVGSMADAACSSPMRSSPTTETEPEVAECVKTELGWTRSNNSSIELVVAVESDVLLRVSAGRVVPQETLQSVIKRAAPMDDAAYLSELHRACNGCLDAGW